MSSDAEDQRAQMKLIGQCWANHLRACGSIVSIAASMSHFSGGSSFFVRAWGGALGALTVDDVTISR